MQFLWIFVSAPRHEHSREPESGVWGDFHGVKPWCAAVHRAPHCSGAGQGAQETGGGWVLTQNRRAEQLIHTILSVQIITSLFVHDFIAMSLTIYSSLHNLRVSAIPMLFPSAPPSFQGLVLQHLTKTISLYAGRPSIWNWSCKYSFYRSNDSLISLTLGLGQSWPGSSF